MAKPPRIIGSDPPGPIGTLPYVPPPLRPGKPLVKHVGELFTRSLEDGTPVAGVAMIVDSDTYLASEATLGAYLKQPPLDRVWAGDNPAEPLWTVQVVFPDEGTATLARAQVADVTATE